MIEMVVNVKKYLVVSKYEDEMYAIMYTPSEIIHRIDMDDCYDFTSTHKLYEVTEDGVYPLVIHGCWHDFKDPLYIKVTRQNGEIVFDGYGTDH